MPGFLETKEFNSQLSDLEFDPSKYEVKHHQYPEDLTGTDDKGWAGYGGHRVVFFINVVGGGKIAMETRDQTIDLPQSRYKQHSGDKLKNMVNPNGTATKDDGIVDKVLKVTNPNRRLKTAISLYIPESLTKSYNVGWGEEDLMGGEAIAQFMLGAAGKTDLASKAAGMWDAGVKAGAGYKATKILNDMKYVQKAAGVSPGNAKAELLFKNVDFGQFSFDYRFAPRSESEAANILNIIRTFRHHMLPEYMDDADFLFIYPSEFEVRYYNRDRENDFLERHMTAVLKSMTINYNPNGQFMTFANGMPTHINMTLQFAELGLPTKKTSPADKPGA